MSYKGYPSPGPSRLLWTVQRYSNGWSRHAIFTGLHTTARIIIHIRSSFGFIGITVIVLAPPPIVELRDRPPQHPMTSKYRFLRFLLRIELFPSWPPFLEYSPFKLPFHFDTHWGNHFHRDRNGLYKGTTGASVWPAFGDFLLIASLARLHLFCPITGDFLSIEHRGRNTGASVTHTTLPRLSFDRL